MVVMSRASERKEQSHACILDAASQALRLAGCNGVGLAEIMREAGLTHGGFFAHFESRDALLAQALEHAGRASALAPATVACSSQADGRSSSTLRRGSSRGSYGEKT